MLRSFPSGVVLCLLVVGLAGPARAQVNPELLAGLEARSIGPAGMSGRIAAIEGVVSNPDILYVGAATGGVWKSSNGGLTWEPIFDDQPVHAIGAIAVYQASPDIVWVGTGEGNPRNSVSVGNGIYKSMDGGRGWTHLGLEETERIHRILLHPSNPDVAYVAAMGKAWGESPERGVFKTEDGGTTWRKVLYVDERTGVADLVMDPTNPNKLLAAMWDYRRWPWSFRSGGPGSGLYLTVDGGRNWKKLTSDDGLPTGELGRIGLAIAPSAPTIVYALIEAKENALYRSEDGGYTWSRTASGSNVGNRPFYYADLRVDPADPNRIYSLWSRVSVSNDGGETFEGLVGWTVHPDHHAMWIDPNDPSHIIEGNDGGVYISHDRGRTWKFVRNLPLAQYYHINVDMETPYNIYGGMQDNGSWRGPNTVWENGGIRNHHWEEVGFGDGFATLAVPDDPRVGYSMSQEGFLKRWDLRTGLRKDIRPASPYPDSTELRFNWNAAIAIDPFDGNTVYYGSQFLHRSPDRGETWTVISPDLTTNNPEWQKQAESGGLTLDVTGAENFTTIMTIAPSPVEGGVIWVGTDDGRVHVTRDGGQTWESVERNIRGVPANTWVPHIEPSRFDAATAFIVLDDHRRSNLTPYVYRTTDHGRSWRSLVTDDIRGYALVVEQDPVKSELLFLGTEFGLYVTLDGGNRWMKWTHGLPTASAMALIIHPRDHDLVIGTHGRAAYVIDDIRPLREITPQVMAESIHLFDVPDAQQYKVKQTGASRFPANGEFRGETRPYGALITYSLNIEGLAMPGEEPAGRGGPGRFRRGPRGSDSGDDGERPSRVKIEISDADGEVIRSFEGPATLGVNRAAWDLRRDGFKRPRGGDQEESFFQGGGPEVLPGGYGIRLSYGDHEATGTVTVLADPRFEIPREERIAKHQAVMYAGALQEAVADAVERIQTTRADIDQVLRRLRGEGEAERTTDNGDGQDDGNRELVRAGRELKESLAALEKRLWLPPDTKGIPADTTVYSRVRYAYGSLSSSWDAPTPAQDTYLRQAETRLAAALADVNRVFEERVAGFRRQVQEAGVEFIEMKGPLAMPVR